jgi:hypothetical protein
MALEKKEKKKKKYLFGKLSMFSALSVNGFGPQGGQYGNEGPPGAGGTCWNKMFNGGRCVSSPTCCCFFSMFSLMQWCSRAPAEGILARTVVV